MLSKFSPIFRRLWAPVLLFTVVVASGLVTQGVNDQAAGPALTSATR